MKSDKRTTSAQSSGSKAMLAATVLTLPLAGLPSILSAQIFVKQPITVQSAPITLVSKIDKYPTQVTIIGINATGQTVYQNAAGAYFSLQPTTGDLQFLTLDESAIVQRASREIDGMKRPQQVTILGLDANGNTLQRNARGETFYLNGKGDMVFVK